ncbi:MAG: hypothetical protein ACYTAS_01780 [Planctomycetota bacterium]
MRGILHEWEPIGFRTPDDEYDCVVHRVLGILYAGGSEHDLASKIAQELEADFGGGFAGEREIRSAGETIWQWWQGRITPGSNEKC